jgi:hypothetical protein
MVEQKLGIIGFSALLVSIFTLPVFAHGGSQEVVSPRFQAGLFETIPMMSEEPLEAWLGQPFHHDEAALLAYGGKQVIKKKPIHYQIPRHGTTSSGGSGYGYEKGSNDITPSYAKLTHKTVVVHNEAEKRALEEHNRKVQKELDEYNSAEAIAYKKRLDDRHQAYVQEKQHRLKQIQQKHY